MTERWQDYTLLQVLVCGLVLGDLHVRNVRRLLNFKIFGPAIWGGCVTRREHRAES